MVARPIPAMIPPSLRCAYLIICFRGLAKRVTIDQSGRSSGSPGVYTARTNQCIVDSVTPLSDLFTSLSLRCIIGRQVDVSCPKCSISGHLPCGKSKISNGSFVRGDRSACEDQPSLHLPEAERRGELFQGSYLSNCDRGLFQPMFSFQLGMKLTPIISRQYLEKEGI
jgi:hypothetical protein